MTVIVDQNLLAEKIAKEAEWNKKYLAEGYTIALNKLETEIRNLRKKMVMAENNRTRSMFETTEKSIASKKKKKNYRISLFSLGYLSLYYTRVHKDRFYLQSQQQEHYTPNNYFASPKSFPIDTSTLDGTLNSIAFSMHALILSTSSSPLMLKHNSS